MKKFLKASCKVISFVLAFCLIFAGLQAVLLPKYGDSVLMVNGLKQLDENSIDVMFMGPSQMYCTVDSKRLTEEYGISSFNFGAASQYLTCTYYYLQEALKLQKPKVVMVEVTSFFLQNKDIRDAEMGWTYALMDWNKEKWDSMLEVSGGNIKTAIKYSIPLLAYHSRWNILGKEDLLYYFTDPDFSLRGFCKGTDVNEQTIKYLSPGNGEVREVPEDTAKAISNIAALCKENNIDVVFFKSPVAEWTRNDSKTVKEFINQNNLDFIDFNDYIYEIGIDSKTDFANELHLNVSGAEKTTDFIAEYLKENYSF